jgi:hypothetical protein
LPTFKGDPMNWPEARESGPWARPEMRQIPVS